MFEIRLRVLDVREGESDPPSFLGIAEGFPLVMSHAVTAAEAEADLVRALIDHFESLKAPEATRLQLDDFPTVRVARALLSLGRG